MKSVKKIRIGEFNLFKSDHKGEVRWLVKFKYSRQRYLYLKSLTSQGVRWSQTLRCWNLPLNFDLELLKKDNIHLQTDYDTGGGSSEVVDAIVDIKYEALLTRMNEYMVRRRMSNSTRKTYLGAMKAFLYRNEIEDISLISMDLVSDYVHRKIRLSRWSYSAQNQFVSALKVFIKVHSLEAIPIEKLERPPKGRKLPTVLTQKEVGLLLRSISHQKHFCILSLIYSAGLRIGETLNLRLEDVSWNEGIIYIRAGKGNKDRRVPLSERMSDTLRRYLGIYKPNLYLFEGTKPGLPYSSSSAQKILKKAVRRAGIKRRVTLHTLRHSYATHLLEKGVGLRYIQEILGHSSPKTTMIYTHVSGKRLSEIKSPLDDLDL